MKKYIAIAALALAVPFFISCTDNDTEENPSLLSRFNHNGEAFMSIDLGLATAEGGATRAEATYDDGVADEYKINNATFVLFATTSTDEIPAPSDLYFKSAYKIAESTDDFDKTEPATPSYSNRVTQFHSKVFTINNSDITDTERLFAFIIVNRNADILTATNGSVFKMVETATDTYQFDMTDAAYKTFDKFSKIVGVSAGALGGFTMTNAPMSTKGSDSPSGASIFYLPEIKATQIYPSEAQAKANPAVTINVERMVAKLEVVNKTGTGYMDGNLKEDNTINYNAGEVRWVLDNRTLPKHSYLVRQASTGYLSYTASTHSSVVRFLDKYPTSDGLYRIFWAEDPDYSVKGSGYDKIRWEYWANPDKKGHFDNAIGSIAYYEENTMDQDNMKQDRSSRIAVRVPFSAGNDASSNPVYNEDFYTSEAFGHDVIFNKPGTSVAAGTTITDKIIEYLSTNDDYVKWKTTNAANIASGAKDNEILSITMMHGGFKDYPSGYESPARTGNGEGTEVKYENGGVVPFGKATVAIACSTAKVNSTGVAAFATDGIAAKLKKVVEENLDVNVYIRGYAFYKVLVRHFNDDEVDKFKTTGSDYPNVYPATNRAQNYLGRFGIVRNTWYTITLEGVRHLGYSSEIPYEEIPDDEVENYLSVRVNVNRWARRNQSQTL